MAGDTNEGGKSKSGESEWEGRGWRRESEVDLGVPFARRTASWRQCWVTRIAVPSRLASASAVRSFALAATTSPPRCDFDELSNAPILDRSLSSLCISDAVGINKDVFYVALCSPPHVKLDT